MNNPDKRVPDEIMMAVIRVSWSGTGAGPCTASQIAKAMQIAMNMVPVAKNKIAIRAWFRRETMFAMASKWFMLLAWATSLGACGAIGVLAM